MKENSDELLEHASHDELLACIRLLATSVVQHRAKCEFVTFENSMAQLRLDADNSDTSQEHGLFVAGSQVLEEALELAKSLVTEDLTRSLLGESTDNQLSENRNQLRINVTAPIKVLWPGETEPVNAQLEDISWGGAAIQVDKAQGDSGDTLEIILPSTQGGSISVEAKIVRTWDLANNQGEGVAIRFSSLSTRAQAELDDILEVLGQASDSQGQRKYARLTQRLDIQFDDVSELQATLEDISTGGLGITVPDPLQLGQSFQAVVSTLDESCSLKLRARVVHQEPVTLGQAELYHVGLEFDHPSEELRDRTEELIKEMAAIKFAKSPANED